MGKCEVNVSAALSTFVHSGIAKVIIVDENRTEQDYQNEPLVAKHSVQIYCERDIDGAENRLAQESCYHANYVLELPATFYHPSQGIVEFLARGLTPNGWRQAAAAPRYKTPDEYVGVGSLFLLTHLIWIFFGILGRWRTYRGTYAVLRTVTREIGTASITYDRPGPWRNLEGATFCPISTVVAIFLRSGGGYLVSHRPLPHKVSAFNNWGYILNLETFGFWRCLFIFIYARLATFPWLALALDPTQWRVLFPVPLILFWIFQAFLALIYCHRYYPDMPQPVFQALVLPMVVVPWILLALWVKLIWRGYQGTRPTMKWPSLVAPTLRGFGDDAAEPDRVAKVE
jgi:hypothetical protein